MCHSVGWPLFFLSHTHSFSDPRILLAGMARTKQTARKATISAKKRPLRVALPGQRLVSKLKVASRVSCVSVSTVQELSLGKTAFQRLVREIAVRMCGEGIRFQSPALAGLQVAAEAYLASLFGDTLRCARHAGRKTIFVKDMRLASRIRGNARLRFASE
jgi:histone H3